MRIQRFVLSAGALVLCTLPAIGQMVSDFEGYSEGVQVIFRQPSFSGSTSAKLDTSIYNSSFVTNTFPGGNPNAGLSVYAVDLAFLSGASSPVWVRLTSFTTGNVPNPTISFLQPLSFDIYSVDRDIEVTLGVRETNTTQPIGADGGTSGGIEWIGGNNTVGKPVSANTWTTITFNIPSETVTAFAGASANGILESTTGKGVLEHLAIIPKSGNTDYHLFIDNIQVVPEPSAVALSVVGGLGLLLAVFRRRNS